MEDNKLNDEDLLWLKSYALDVQDGQPAPLETLARLERQGLLMRGWGHRHVVTDQGRVIIDCHIGK